MADNASDSYVSQLIFSLGGELRLCSAYACTMLWLNGQKALRLTLITPDHLSSNASASPTLSVVGTGSALPSIELTNADLTKYLDTTDSWITDRVGIHKRNICSAEESTLTLAEAASKKALENAGMLAQEVDLLIVATFTPEQSLPSTAALVAERLGIQKTVAFDLQAACSGFLFAFVTAESLMQSLGKRTALLIGVDVLSRAVDWRDRNTAVLFGDGAGACVLQAPESGFESCILGAYLQTAVQGAGLIEQGSKQGREYVDPATAPSARADISPHLTMQGRSVYKQGVQLMIESIEHVLDDAGVTIDDVSLFVPHQSNIRMIQSVCEQIGLTDSSRVVNNIERVGNTSAASIPIVLDECVQADRLKRGDLLLMTSVGSGMTYGSVLIEW